MGEGSLVTSHVGAVILSIDFEYAKDLKVWYKITQSVSRYSRTIWI